MKLCKSNRECQQLGFVMLDKNLDVKVGVDLGYNHQVHDKKSFNINLFHLFSLLIYSLNILFLYFTVVTHRIKSQRNFPQKIFTIS